MFDKYQYLIINEIHKSSYIQCITDTVQDLQRITNNINNDIQLVINCAKKELKNLDDAKNTADKVLTVFLSSEENINTARHNFLNAYHLWLDEALKVNSNLTKTKICKNNLEKKPSLSYKSIHDKYVIEIEDSSESDIEIVNEIKYLTSQKFDSDSDEDEVSSKSSKNEIQKIILSKTKIEETNSDNLSENLNEVVGTDGIQNASIEILDDPIAFKDGDHIQSETTYSLSAANNDNTTVSEINKFSVDQKLNVQCMVVIERLANPPNYNNKKSILDDDEEFSRLIDLDSLEKPRKKRPCSSSEEFSTNSSDNSSSLSNNFKVKRKNKKFKASSSNSEVSSFYYSSSDEDNKKSINNNEEYFAFNHNSDLEKTLTEECEERLKQKLLLSDDSTESDTEVNVINGDNDKKSTNENEKEKKTERIAQKSNSNSSSTDDDRTEKSTWMRDKLLTFKLNDEKRKKKNFKRIISVQEESDSESDIITEPIVNKKKKKIQLEFSQSAISTDSSSINNSSSNDSDSDDCQIVKNNPQLSTPSQVTGNLTTSEDQLINNAITPSKPSGRRNIRKVFDDEEVTDATRRAGRDEENRLQRLAERRKQLQLLLTEKNKEKDTLILDFDIEKGVELIKVDRGLVKFLKPHQAEGVKFMWESCFETLEQVRNSDGSGCILAHCMGLGKTFQIVTLVHTILVNKATGINTVMVVCPMNTILNWVEEFDMWLKHTENQTKIRVYDLTQIKKTSSRIAQLKFWHELGGVLVLSYDMFRLFTSHDKKLSPQQGQKMRTYLLNPGADFVVCDEGHLLKNEASLLAHRMQSIRTKRRVILTGTPLQNNLSEYHCMVQFVKPNLLGTKVEFQNRFGNPIVNGQFDNSTPHDVKLMKHRAHVLHRMLEGCVQRYDYAVLTPFLPPKQEYVILLHLSELQIEMYQYFIENIARVDAKHCRLFKNYHEIKRLIAHPKTMQLKDKSMKKSSQKSNKNSTNTNAKDLPNSFISTEEEYWWSRFLKDEQVFDFTLSYKLIFLYGILERCKKEGDKILVFSQCLHTLKLIELFLKQIDSKPKQNGFTGNLFDFQDEWKPGLDYFRLDGSVSSDKRNAMCKTFNNPMNKRARLFLISTKAGGLGINLIGANRVVIFDPSWNPSNDVQGIFRVFRFGQNKPCYVYRLLTAGTMEQKIYNRQVTKLSLSLRVLDEQQIERHYRDSELAELYKLEILDDQPIINVPKDHVLADVFLKFKDYVYQFFEHDSLLENKEEEELDEDERKQAWLEYQQEKHAQVAKITQKKRVFDKTAELSTFTKDAPSPAITIPTDDDVVSSLSNLDSECSE